ncbi:hypothetical protein DFJ43DRAFT_999382 [Lentinula guzmanii]|uniref:Uncharacterized protein n=1 Tax=Lentinula guzmanii TaxID=2804957 RepID=A0AA38JIN7_9AGAR|nr:hypothetical protein DFJ43DRAFT_999382 [Lentinula guzmanii]
MANSDLDPESGRSSPILTSLNSSSALILVHDDEEETLDADYVQEPEDTDDDDDSPYLGITRPYVQPLSPTTVLLYLLAPYLKLGAMLLPNADLPLKLSIPLLLAFAVLAAFARQIWYLLSRYLQKGPGEEDVLVDAFSISRGSRITRQRIRGTIRSGTRAVTGISRLFLATTYLRASHTLLLSLPSDIYISNWAFTLILALFIYPFVIAQSLGSKRIIYSTWISIASYVLWLFCVIYAHANGAPTGHSSWLRMGSLWEGVTTIAFTFTSSSTLTLYASLKASAHAAKSAATKTPLSRSFKILSIVSVALAVCLTFPSLIFAASPNKPQSQDTPSYRLGPFILALSAITLLLGIPLVLTTTPSLPIPERLRRRTTIPLSKTIIFIIVVALSLVPMNVFRVYSDMLIICALAGTYFLPALVHITTHFFKRPLSIIVPALPLPPLPDSSFSLVSPTSTTPNSANDPLLQRKELMLRRKQFGRRIIWDIGVWTLLLPVGGGGFLWAAARIAGRC